MVPEKAVQSGPIQSFSFGVAHLRAFTAREGHSRVRLNHQEAYFALGRWVEDVRSAEGLGETHIAEIESIPHWSWESTAVRRRRDSASNFDAGYLVLLDFVDAEGHARVAGMRDGEVSELSRWVKARRDDFKSGRLSNDQIAKLDALPGWVWDEQYAKFLDAVARMERYIETHSSSAIPRGFRDPVDGFSLGAWAHTQRCRYSDGMLHGDRARALERVDGWRW